MKIGKTGVMNVFTLLLALYWLQNNLGSSRGAPRVLFMNIKKLQAVKISASINPFPMLLYIPYKPLKIYVR